MSLTLYYSPGACSLADHIALLEGDLAHDLVRVDLDSKRTEDGRDFTAINPKGYVPVIEQGGEIFTENAALLQMIAEEAGSMLPQSGPPRYRVLEAVAFITTEVHKSFAPLFADGSDEEKAAARDKLSGKFDTLASMLGDGEFIAGDAFSIADCYAFVTLLWAGNKDVGIPPSLEAYRERLHERASVKAALESEGLA